MRDLLVVCLKVIVYGGAWLCVCWLGCRIFGDRLDPPR
jgi:hypothetical protein